MTITELGEILGDGAVVAVAAQAAGGKAEIGGGYTSDLLSDVMANAKTGDVLVTIQAHRNTVAVAGIVGIAVIVVCNGREVPADMAEAARDEGIAVFVSPESQFRVSGRIWTALHAEGRPVPVS
ncbi:MAG: hypothetical protein ABFC75_04670 [Rectinema sp.]